MEVTALTTLSILLAVSTLIACVARWKHLSHSHSNRPELAPLLSEDVEANGASHQRDSISSKQEAVQQQQTAVIVVNQVDDDVDGVVETNETSLAPIAPKEQGATVLLDDAPMRLTTEQEFNIHATLPPQLTSESMPFPFMFLLPTELVVANEENINKVFTKHDLNGSRVIRFVGNRNCDFTLSRDIGQLTKVFVEECSDTTITVECKILTQHIEVIRCERLQLLIRVRTDTLQVDLSTDVRIICDKDSCRRVYHAGVQGLKVCSQDSDTCIEHDYRFPDDPILLNRLTIPTEEQYLTQIIGSEMRTHRVQTEQGALVPTIEGNIETCNIRDSDK